MYKGHLIGFDGLDASGKATQVARCVENLRKHGYTVHQFDTPDYDTPSGRDLKLRLQGKKGDWVNTPWQEKMDYFAKNRAEKKEQVIQALEAGDIVVYDRYIPSSMTFMAIEADDTVSSEKVYEVVQDREYNFYGMPKEDVSFFLDVPPTFALALLNSRKDKHGDADEYTDSDEVQINLYNQYDALYTANHERYKRITCVQDNQLLSIEAIADDIWNYLTKNILS